jgi:hypothetical protein
VTRYGGPHAPEIARLLLSTANNAPSVSAEALHDASLAAQAADTTSHAAELLAVFAVYCV